LLKAQLEAEGTRLDDFDLAIAACALGHGLTLVTNSIAHFARVPGLRLKNWTESRPGTPA
jgi:tRNA(fMet)-specific endonuclease VapC